MTFNLIPYFAIWSAVALAVIVLLVMRKVVSSREDDQLHVLHGTVSEQVTVAARLEAIDKWGKILTAIAAISGLALAAVYVYSSFLSRGM